MTACQKVWRSWTWASTSCRAVGESDPLICAARYSLNRVVNSGPLTSLIRTKVDKGTGWPDAVAGRMERHYSPGRTWADRAGVLRVRARGGAIVGTPGLSARRRAVLGGGRDGYGYGRYR